MLLATKHRVIPAEEIRKFVMRRPWFRHAQDDFPLTAEDLDALKERRFETIPEDRMDAMRWFVRGYLRRS